jgi:hypothetical protein
MKEAAMRERENAQGLQLNDRRGWKRLLIPAMLFLCLLPAARAQRQEEQKGVDQGDYNIKQSIEFGGRLTSISGNQNVYDTFVNLQQGARLLGFTTEMRSLDHHATFSTGCISATSVTEGTPTRFQGYA